MKTTRLFAVLFLILFSCQFIGCYSSSPKVVDSIRMNPNLKEQIVFSEDFNNNKNGWYIGESNEALVTIENGNYLFEHKRNKGGDLAGKKGMIIDPKKNFQIDATIKKISGLDKYGYGIVWGRSDKNNYYKFAITDNGSYKYGRAKNNQWLDKIGWRYSQYIKKSNSINKLSINKSGDYIEFWINDNYVNKAPFEEFFGNSIGFTVSNKIKIAVDNLVVKYLTTDNSSLYVAQQKAEPQKNSSQSATQKPESVTFQYHNYQHQPINKLQTTQQPSTQKSDSQPLSQPKPADPKTQPTAKLTQVTQQVQQPQPIQQQQQPIVYAKPQLADRRIALVIGNEKYINAPLENPVNDSRAIGNSLKKLGFKTLEYENLSQKAMKRAIDDFGIQLKNYDVGLFFYSGHGTQIKGENYLIPIDAAPKSENEVDYDCIPAGRVLAQMENTGSVTNIIILDACRNNPFERSWSRSSQSKGLVFMNAPSGSLIAYSTSPGKIAFDQSSKKNSPYTAALLKHIETPNISIVEMFQRVRVTVEHETGKEQTPWESTSLRDNFYFYRQNVQ